MTLDYVAHRADTDFSKANALQQIAAGMEKGKQEPLTKQMQAVRAHMQAIDKQLKQSIDLNNDGIVETKLEELLLQLERERLPARPMSRRHGGLERLLQELLDPQRRKD